MKKSLVINFLKFAFAISLLAWLVSSGNLDFVTIQELLTKPVLIICVMFFMLINHFISAIRWKLILDQKSSLPLKLTSVFKANWIGIFFNSVLPGSVSGDFIKIFYVKELDKNLSNQYMLGSILIDRVIGLFGLISVGGIVCLISFNKLINISSDVKKLVEINLFLFAIVIISMISVFAFESLPHRIAKPFREVKLLGGIVIKLEEVWTNLCRIRKQLIAVLFISILIQTIAAFNFWYLVTPFIDGEFSFSQAIMILPIGFIIMSLPISPAGLGVGHAAFQTLFGYIGISEGANLFNIYFILVLITNLTGLFPYVLNKKQLKTRL